MNRHVCSRALLDLAYQYPCFLRFPCCEGGDAGEPAHSNQHQHGKGGMIKAHDVFHVPACRAWGWCWAVAAHAALRMWVC